MSVNATFIGQMIFFVIFVWFCMKYVWPPILSSIAERQNKIAEGLQNAQKASKDLELAKVSASNKLKAAKAEAVEIVEQANKMKVQIIDEAKQEADIERSKIIKQGHLTIESEKARVKEELRKQVAFLAIKGAEKIIESSINESMHKDMLDKLASEL